MRAKLGRYYSKGGQKGEKRGGKEEGEEGGRRGRSRRKREGILNFGAFKHVILH